MVGNEEFLFSGVGFSTNYGTKILKVYKGLLENLIMVVAAIVMSGFPATGKTFIAKKLADSFKETHSTVNIASLDFRKKFNFFNLKSDGQRDEVYDLLVKHVSHLVQESNQDILLIDGNFNKRKRRERLYSVLGGCPVYLIHCTVSNEEIIKERMEERQRNIHIFENKAATMELYDLIKDDHDNVEEDELVKKGAINLIQFNSENKTIEKTNLSKENNVKEITAKISSIIESNMVVGKG